MFINTVLRQVTNLSSSTCVHTEMPNFPRLIDAAQGTSWRLPGIAALLMALSAFGYFDWQKYEKYEKYEESARLDKVRVAQIEADHAAEEQGERDKIVADTAAAETIASRMKK